jgi:hypothetical protein
MIKIGADNFPLLLTKLQTRADLNTDNVYVLTTVLSPTMTIDLHLREDGGCRIVQWEDYFDEKGELIETEESSILSYDLYDLIEILQEATQLAEGYFDNAAWSS